MNKKIYHHRLGRNGSVIDGLKENLEGKYGMPEMDFLEGIVCNFHEVPDEDE